MKKSRQKIIFVGSQNLGGLLDDGETMKNHMLSVQLEKLGCKVSRIDTRNRPKRVWYLIKYLCLLVFCRSSKIVMSASPYVADKLFKISKLFGWNPKQHYYWVIGGTFGKLVNERTFNPASYIHFHKIVVEGEQMKKQLESDGFHNVMVLPNMKRISYVPVKKRANKTQTRFVFLSRVMPEKGVDYIIDASRMLAERGMSDFTVHLYGRIAPSYEKTLQSKLEGCPSVEYKGFLMLDKPEGYDTLASYDVMLFPTYWHGEGFPGILIDAFVAGLPIIATNWNLNTSLIKDGYDGMIIPVHDVNALCEAMGKVVDGSVDVRQLSENAQREAMKYDVDNVVNKKLLEDLDII